MSKLHQWGESVIAGGYVSDLRPLFLDALFRCGKPAAVVSARRRDTRIATPYHSDRVAGSARAGDASDGDEDMRQFRAAVLGDPVRPAESL